MLTIFMLNQDEPFVRDSDVAALFRTVRVVSGVPFLELSPGHLVNLTAVERIIDDTVPYPADLPDQCGDSSEVIQRDVEQRATPVPGGPGCCPHGFIQGTCSRCERGNEPHDHSGTTCLRCAADARGEP